MKFLKRLWSFVSNRAHLALDSVESPDDKLQHFLNELQKKVIELQNSVTGAVVEEKKLERTLDDQLKNAIRWEERAKIALQEGKEDLARQALQEQSQLIQVIEATRTTLNVQKQAVGELKNSLVQSKAKLGDAKRQYQLALARYKSAETKVKLASVSSMTAIDSPIKLLEELDEKILKLEAEADTQIMMRSENHNVDLDAEFRKLESSRDIDAKLNALRVEGPSRAELPLSSGQELKDKLNS